LQIIQPNPVPMKKIITLALAVTSAFALFSCKKDTPEIDDPNKGAPSGIYLQYTIKGKTETFQPPDDTISSVFPFATYFYVQADDLVGETLYRDIYIRFGQKFPTAKGTYTGEFCRIWVREAMWENDSLQYTVTRPPAASKDTIELSFSTVLMLKNEGAQPDTAKVYGRLRTVYE